MVKDILNSFSHPLSVCLIGSSGGIGKAFAAHIKALDYDVELNEFSRSETGFDFAKEETIKKAAEAIPDQSVDLIIIATGYLGTSPEKSLKDISADQFQDSFLINTIGPALTMKHFAPKLKRDEKSVMVALSARVGSIEDNRLGGWYGYRASKAALNMIIRTTAIEVARQNKMASVIGLQPGTVDTSLSKPFQDHVPEGKLFTPEYATKSMLNVINDISSGDSGNVYAYDGQKIPF